jgi:hypothetical protein
MKTSLVRLSRLAFVALALTLALPLIGASAPPMVSYWVDMQPLVLGELRVVQGTLALQTADDGTISGTFEPYQEQQRYIRVTGGRTKDDFWVEFLGYHIDATFQPNGTFVGTAIARGHRQLNVKGTPTTSVNP